MAKRTAKKLPLDRPIPPQDIRTEVAFEPWSTGQQGPYFTVHYSEDGTTLLDQTPDPVVRLPLVFAKPAHVAGTIEYEISGDAVEGVNYTVLTPSPLPVEPGQAGSVIEVELLDAGAWFRERMVRLLLTGGKHVRIGEHDEFRLLVRPTEDPPSVQWTATEASGGPGVYRLTAELETPSADVTTLYYDLRGSAEHGVDYEIDPPGTITIPPGATTGTVQLVIRRNATSRALVILVLEHERDDGSDRNLWTHTHDWSLEVDELRFPGFPSSHIPGGGTFLTGAPQHIKQQRRGVDIVPQTTREPKTAWDGHVLQGLVQSQWITSGFYIRESFEDQIHAAGPPRLTPLQPYSRVSVYVETFGPPEEAKNSRFVRVTLRNRVLDLNHAVMFDRESTGVDWQGNPVPVVEAPTGSWSVWRTSELHADDELGVVVERIDGRDYTRLYYMHHADNETVYTNAKGDPVVETVGQDRLNAILRFTYFSEVDGSSQATGGAAGNRGKGLLAFHPRCERSSSPLQGPPPKFWERRNFWWEPRGNATIPAAGGQNLFTFTIA